MIDRDFSPPRGPFPALAFVALFAAFCVALPAAEDAVPPEGRILLLTHKIEGFRNAFWDALRAGAEASARDAGYLLEYRGVSPERKDDPAAAQAEAMRRAADAGYAGILLTPVDRYRLVSAVRYAALLGVPVAAVDSPIESDLLAGIALTNSYEGGLLAAEEMVRLCGGAGDIAMIAHPSRGNKTTLDREQAFRDGLERFGGGRMRLLGGIRFGDGGPEGDYRAAISLLDDFPSIRAVYCVYGNALSAMLRALRDKGRSGKVFLIGWDSDIETLKALESGEVHAIMQQDPDRMARAGVELLVAARRGVPVRRFLSIPAVLVTARNMGIPPASSLLAPIRAAAAAIGR